MQRIALALALLFGLALAPAPFLASPGYAQAPPPVPAEPDTERRTRYSGVSSVSTFSIAFDLYGDGVDYQNWLEVWVNGLLIPQAGNWTLTTNTGTLSTLARPILAGNANIVFAIPQTGTVDIVGARRPRRTSQFNENAGVPARSINQVVTDLWMTERERWDRLSRTITAPPGETLSPLPPAATRALGTLGFSVTGDLIVGIGNIGNTTVSAPILPFVQAASIAAARTILGADDANNLVTGTLGYQRLPAGVPNNRITNLTSGATADSTWCGGHYRLGGNALYTIVIPAAGGLSANCLIDIENSDVYSGVGTGRGKYITASGVSNLMLYPGQTVRFRQNASAWAQEPSILPPWIPQSNPLNFYIDTAGSDTTGDGLAAGASAFRTLAQCVHAAYYQIYVQNSIYCQPTAGQTFQEQVQVYYPLPGGSVLQFQGNGGSFIWKPIPAGYALVYGDYAGVGVQNVLFDGTAVSAVGIFYGHQYGVLDTNLNVSIQGSFSTGIFSCDSDTHVNVLNGLGIGAGSSGGFIFSACQRSTFNINGAIAFTSSPTYGRFAYVVTGASLVLQGNVSFTGTITTSGAYASGNSVINNLSGMAMPGGVPTIVTGAQYCTVFC